MRKICVLELFTLKNVQSFRPIREQEVEFMINSISEHSSTSMPVDLSQRILTLTADITCRVVFGKNFREGEGLDVDRFQEIIHEAFAMLGSFSAADFFPYFGWIVDRITGLYKRREMSFHDLDSFYQKLIDDHLNARKSNKKDHQDYDIIDVMFNYDNHRIVPYMIEMAFIVLCGALKSMDTTRLPRGALHSSFKIDILKDYLEFVTYAYLAMLTKNSRESKALKVIDVKISAKEKS
ncbi:hypothetical protein ACFE04_029741 [Oxalis oulophora]